MKLIISNRREIEKLMQQNKPDIKGFKKDKLFYVISKLYWSSVMDEQEEGISLCSEILQGIIGNNYHSYMTYLLNNRVIRISKWYEKGFSCFRYELYPLFIGEPEWYEVKDFTFRQKLKGMEEQRKYKKQYPYLYKWMEKLRIDADAAIQWAKDDKFRKTINPSLQDDKKNGKGKIDPFRQYLHNMMVIKWFKENKPFKVDDSGRRLHTIITRSSKNLRNFVTCDGKPLVVVDLKNSQPYLLVSLLNNDFWEKKGTYLPVKSIIYGLSLNLNSLSSIMPSNTSETIDCNEFQRYRLLAETGRIYEHFETLLKLPTDVIKNGKAREVAKFRMMLCLYSQNKTHSGGMKTAFKKEFQTIYSLIRKIKEKKHNTLALLLQRIESYLILDVICKRISAENPDLPIFTIHDSIVTTVGNEDYIKKVMEEELKQFVGIKPKVSFEKWNADSLSYELLEIPSQMSA